MFFQGMGFRRSPPAVGKLLSCCCIKCHWHTMASSKKANVIKTSQPQGGLLIQAFALLAFFLLSLSVFSQPALPPDPFLADYLFETTNWLSIDGDAPIAFTNLASVSLWNKNALLLDTTNAMPAFLNYNVVESDGFTNVTFDQGAVRCVFITDWATEDTNQNGTGPGDTGYLVAAGDWSTGSPDGFWAVYIDPGGTNIYFGGVSNSTTNIFVSAPISWPSNSIHLIGAIYSSTNSQLFLDGQLAATGGPVTVVPATNTWTNGFFVGSDNSGYEQSRGVFSSLEFFDSNVFNPDWSEFFTNGYIFTNGWPRLTNAYYTWLVAQGDGFTFGGSGADYWTAPPTPTNSVNTNYANYTNFWVIASNSPTQVYVSVVNTLSNIAYEVLTNDNLASTNWGVWQAFVASNAVTPMPPLNLTSNALFFRGVMISQTGTNGLPDWWCLEYFNTLNVDPYADPDGDGLCNLDEFTLGTNPTNAYSLSALHKDAAALLLAFTNYDAGCTYQLSIASCSDTNVLLATITPTLVGTNYQIYSHDESDTNNTWIVETNFVGTNTSTTVPIYLNGRTLCLIGGYGEDSDGDGLPDGYEVLATWTDPYLPDTGLSGTGDGYKDPDGDGYSNLQEMFNGTNPHVFNTPAGPINPVADLNTNGTVNFSWEAASGPVTGYVVYVWDDSLEDWLAIATNAPNQLTYLLSNPGSYSADTAGEGLFEVSAIFAGGPSSLNGGQISTHPAWINAALVHGPGGKTYVLTSIINTNVVGYNVQGNYQGAGYPEWATYFQSITNYLGGAYDFYQTNFYLPASQFTNGMALLSDEQAPPYTQLNYYGFVPVLPGNLSGSVLSAGPALYNPLNVPFLDGTACLKQNVRFLLRGACWDPFAYALTSGSYGYSPDYVSSSVYSASGVDHLIPFEDNYFFANFIFNSSLVQANGTLGTGFAPVGDRGFDYVDAYNQISDVFYEFPTYDYVNSSNSASIPGMLSSNNTRWASYVDPSFLSDFGIYGNTSMTGFATNCYGLPYNSAELTCSNSGGIYFQTLTPSSSVSGYNGLPFYAEAAQPELQTVGYYFGRPFAWSPYGYSSYYGDPLPLSEEFNVTNVTPPLMLGSVGTSMLIAGYAKQAVLNGGTNVFAYLGQYFTNAFVVSNGGATTNSGGILSEYGEFFPTVPGQIALMTKPDPDQTNIQGTCLVDIIRLSLDVNHDGVMDESFTGPDNTSTSVPYVFWANNDYDRWNTDSPFDTIIEDGVASDSPAASSPYTGKSTPDYEYRDINGNRIIPCPRDLEDFARLWVSGISSNVLTNLSPGSTVTLSWAGIGTSPTIDLFQAADADGGVGYLTNLATASNQINTNLCQYIGRLGPGSNIVLNSSSFSNNWAGDHYIWCGVFRGSDQLNLTIYDPSSNVLARSSQLIQIEDIKLMYERWTVGDIETNSNGTYEPVTPASVPYLAQNDEPIPGQQPFQYTYDPAYDTNDTYILFVHGYNMETWEKDCYAETAYKRLYWQGYQGRFGEFRWPEYPSPLFVYAGEQQAWNSGVGLRNLLGTLSSYYPSNVYVLAHSMGNVVVGEALRQAGTNKVVNTYVASQAAVSAHAYDNTIPTDTTNYYRPISPDSTGHYYTNTSPPYFNGIAGAATYVNFINTNDWALMGATLFHPGWISFQQDKLFTQEQSAVGGFDLSYFYTTPSSNHPSGYYNQPATFQAGVLSPYRNLLFTNDTYEIFAFAAQSYSLALGAETTVPSGFARSVNLFGPPYNFGGEHVGHSLQFRSDNMTTAVYWQELISFGFNIQP